MGATGWHHFGPYTSDLALALEHLCRRVVADGEYRNLWRPLEQERADVTAYVDELIADIGLDATLARYEQNDKGITPTTREDVITILCTDQTKPPQTLRDILRYHGVEGTNSILDYIASSNYEPLPFDQAAARLKPISQQAVQEIFGTPTPSRALVETRLVAVWQYLMRDRHHWEGDYFLVYEAGVPVEWVIFGMTFG